MGLSENSLFPVEHALEMMIFFDGFGKITYGHAAAMKKLEYGEDLCGKYIYDIFPNEFFRDRATFQTDAALDGNVQKLSAYRKNMTCFPVEAKILKDHSDTGGYLCMANDILEKEFLNKEVDQVRREAAEALKVKSEFVANVTHELRTPVNGVLGNVKELLAEELEQQIKKPLLTIERCCDDMNKIINNILDFSKLEAGKFTLEPRKFHFRNMMDYVKASHSNKITEKGLGFFVTVSPQIPEYIIGDELRIVQILGNLLSNARKFTSVGKITLEAVRTAQVNDKIELFFMVKDTGIGIDESDKDKLFQSFSQVDASISRKYGGTGLGLNISKQLVELMGGRIEVESEKNRGSNFSFSVWAGVCEEDAAALKETAVPLYTADGAIASDEEHDFLNMKKFGTPENKESLKNNLSKLILCVEMNNWEKAEMFMDTVKQLTEGAPREVGRVVLRLKMAIQKENYDKITAEFEALNHFLN